MSGFATTGEPCPRVSHAQAATLLARHWGLSGTLRDLGSQQDRNLRVDTGDARYVLKVANRGVPRAALEAQHAALDRLHGRLGGVAVPCPVPTLEGATVVVDDVASGRHDVRLLTYVDGVPLVDVGHLAPPVLHDLGGLVGRLTAVLADFDHPGTRYRSQWDLRHTEPLVATLAPELPDELSARITRAVAAVAGRLHRVAATLPTQVCHADAHDGNLLCRRGDDGRPVLCGVIDVGDLVHTWRISDLAIAATSVVRRSPTAPLAVLRPLVEGFAAHVPLTDEECAALWPAVVWRAAGDACATAHGLVLEPDNTYLRTSLDGILQVLDAVVAVPPDVVEAEVRAAVGRPPSAAARGMAAVVGHAAEAWRPLLPGAVAPPEVVCHHGAVVDDPEPHVDEPATRHLGVRLAVPPGARVGAPLAAEVAERGPGRVVLRAGDVEVVLDGVSPVVTTGVAVAAGTCIGRAHGGRDTDGPAGLLVRCSVPGVRAPDLVPASTWPAWDAVVADPSRWLGVAAASGPSPDAAGLLARRQRVLGGAQAWYYARPPEIAWGRGAVLVDTVGRARLDMINNVTVVGHAHPAVTAAVRGQLDRCNTNSRFLYEPLVAFAERLGALLPPPLDTVFVVTSGSEANELALRLVRLATGHRDVLHLDDSYHGWTTAVAALSGELAESRDGTLPGSEVAHAVPSPNRYRGPFRDADAVDRYVGSVAATVDRLVAAGRPPAAFLSESLLGNAGGVVLPEGYLARVYELVRRAGGLAIADEVQVGYGRLGTSFWGFEQHGVVPDVVTVAKAVGNGYPIGAVVTTRAIADAYAERAYFFSSAGGSPAGCAAGLAVLDVIEREGLQERARVVGARLRGRLEDLRDRHPVIGTVHGQGLYLGLELVRDRDTREPARAETAAICDRLLDLGVVVQPTSVHGNVVKIKPPLCLSEDDAEVFADRLDLVLRTGW